MPEMDGAMLAQALQNAAPTLPLVSLSSRWPQHQPSRHFRACLSKPVKPAPLYETLVGIFEPGAVTPQAAPARPRFDPRAAERHP